MSTIGDVLKAANKLVVDIDAVLNTDTAKQAPEIAQTLGVQQQLKDGIGKVEGAIDQFVNGLEPVRHVAVMADALVAMFGIAPPLVTGLGDVVSDAGNQLAALGLGLDGVKTVTGGIGDVLHTIGSALDVADDAAEDLLAFVDASQFGVIIGSLKKLKADFDKLKQDPVAAKMGGQGGGGLLGLA
jgi:hypothetical protein